MKKIYPLIAIVLIMFSTSLHAQITINRSHLPAAGDTLRFSTVNPLSGVNFASTGADTSWNYTSLTAISQDIAAYKNAIQTPYVFSFFGAFGAKIADSLGIGTFKIEDIYQFYEANSSGFRAKGLGFKWNSSLPQKGEYTDLDEIYLFPLQFNDRDSSNFKLKIPISIPLPPLNLPIQIGSYFQSGYRITTVDGWGTISTPYASNVPCLRIKSIIYQNDSINITIPTVIGQSFSQVRIEYKWLSTTEKIPMLEVTGTEVNGNFIASSIRFRDNYRNLNQNNSFSPIASFKVNKNSGFVNDTFFFTSTAQRFPTTHAWEFTPSNGVQFINGTSNSSENPVVIVSQAGSYSVKYSAGNLIGTDDTTVTNCLVVGNQPASVAPFGIISPELFFHQETNSIHVLNACSFSIYNIEGKIIKNIDAIHPEIIDLGSLPNGIYFIIYQPTSSNKAYKFYISK